MTLLELAERCERATGPDRELDALIWMEVTPSATRRETVVPPTSARKGWTIDETRDGSGRLIVVPAYSASLDAAMTLVPEGDGVAYILGDGPWAGPHARIWEISAEKAAAGAKEPIAWEVGSNAHTLPLALCAAALRARATLPEGEER